MKPTQAQAASKLDLAINTVVFSLMFFGFVAWMSGSTGFVIGLVFIGVAGVAALSRRLYVLMVNLRDKKIAQGRLKE